jgi:hypothetical protein
MTVYFFLKRKEFPVVILFDQIDRILEEDSHVMFGACSELPMVGRREKITDQLILAFLLS